MESGSAAGGLFVGLLVLGAFISISLLLECFEYTIRWIIIRRNGALAYTDIP